jgi:integrase
MRVLFSDDLLQSLAAAPPARRKRYSDQVQRGLVFDLTSSGGYFGFRYSFGGQQRMLGLGRFGVVDLASVRQEVTGLIHDLVDGHDPGVKRRAEASFLTLKQFYEEQYLPHVRTYKVSEATDANYFANHLLPFFGEAKMAEISRSEVSRFVSQKQAEGLKPSSINRYLMTLRHAFNVALEWDVPGVSRNPLQRYPLLKENNLLNRFLTGEEAERLKAALAESPNRELGAIVGFLLVTGARKTEVLEARWDQFDLERRQWRVPKAKSGYHRFIPISDGALAVLRAREALRAMEPSGGASPWVFPNPATGKPYMEIFNAWNTARRKAGLPDLRIHDLRHSFASSLVNGGTPLYEVQKLLGHSSIRTTERYAHLAPERLLGSMRISDAAFGKVAAPRAAAAQQLELFT